VHCGLELGRHIAGLEDRLPGWLDAVKQQVALMIGVVVSTIIIGVTLNAMNTNCNSFLRRHSVGIKCAA